MVPNPLVIYGAGGLGREILQLVNEINNYQSQWDVIGFADDNLREGTLIHGKRVLGGADFFCACPRPVGVVLAVGDTYIKQKMAVSLVNSPVYYPVLVHPSVTIHKSVRMAEGIVITAGNLLTVDIRIGRHVLLNLSCTTGHDAVIGDFCSVMPGVNISGNVVLEDGVYVGTGARILNNVIVGRDTTVGGGAVVVRSLPASCTAVGVPARPVKFHV